MSGTVSGHAEPPRGKNGGSWAQNDEQIFLKGIQSGAKSDPSGSLVTFRWAKGPQGGSRLPPGGSKIAQRARKMALKERNMAPRGSKMATQGTNRLFRWCPEASAGAK